MCLTKKHKTFHDAIYIYIYMNTWYSYDPNISSQKPQYSWSNISCIYLSVLFISSIYLSIYLYIYIWIYIYIDRYIYIYKYEYIYMYIYIYIYTYLIHSLIHTTRFQWLEPSALLCFADVQPGSSSASMSCLRCSWGQISQWTTGLKMIKHGDLRWFHDFMVMKHGALMVTPVHINGYVCKQKTHKKGTSSFKVGS